MKSVIKAECDFCMNRGAIGKYNICQSTICKLNDKSLTPLKRIKAHCLSCIPEHDLKAVQECTGRLIDDKTCPLHVYRLGKNPKRAGKGNKNPSPDTRFKKIVKNQQTHGTQQPFVYQKIA
jgi:hypothetical protein